MDLEIGGSVVDGVDPPCEILRQLFAVEQSG